MNDMFKAMRYMRPERVPVSVSLLPATRAKYGRALVDMCREYPELFGNAPSIEYYTPPSYRAGAFTDAWGCVWTNISEGYESIVTGHPLKTRAAVRALRAPTENIGLPHGFMFLRLTDLRGFEEMMIDFAEEPPELQLLIDIVRDYNVRQLRLLIERDKSDIVYLGDDNGMQASLPISPATWRKYMKPAYEAIFSVAREAGRAVYFHTDGCIYPVMPDMREAGADMINPQVRANGLDNLVSVCNGKIPICLDLDRQLFPFATPAEIEAHIRECYDRLYLPEGGLALTAECAADVPLPNIDAVCRALVSLQNA